MKNKLQPQAPEMECAVIGALLLEKECFNRITDILRAEDFYVDAHRFIYEAVASLAGRHQPVDMLTVMEELKRTGKLDICGGAVYISELTSRIASTAHAEYHAQIVKEKAHARRLIRIASWLVDKAYDPTGDIYELQEKFEKAFTGLVTDTGAPLSLDMPAVLKAAVDDAAHKQEQLASGRPVGIPTGIPALDKLLNGGLQPPDLAVLAARPSMGKTQMALWIAQAAARAGFHVLIVSIEMTDIAIANRYILADERIDEYHYRTGNMLPEEWEAVDETVGKLWNLPIRIAADASIRKLGNILSEARRLKRIGLLDMLLVDYTGLVQTGLKFDLRYKEVGYITSELKNLAKELSVAVVLLSQLNRPLKGTRPKPPVMEDLRESGDIEQDADRVLFLHKPDYYDPECTDSDGSSWKNRGQIIIAKNRDGIRNTTIEYRHDDRYKNLIDN